MKTTEQFLIKLKEQYNVPKGHIKIYANISKLENYFKEGIKFESLHVDVFDINVDIKNMTVKNNEDFKSGIYKLDDIYYIVSNIYDDDLSYNQSTEHVFAPSIEAFEKFILKNCKYDETKIPRIPFGSYKLEETQQGTIPVPITLSEEVAPILNEDISENLNKEIELFKKKKDWYKKNNLTHKRGFLLYGPPGNGKTSYIKNIPTDDKILIFLDVQKSNELDFVTEFLSNEDYRDITKIIVMEDLERMASVKSHVLNMLDGIFEIENTVFLATTNYPEQLDVAITKRPSRFDSLYSIDLPCAHTRQKIFKLYFPKASDAKCKEGAEMTDGMTGAYIKEMKIMSEYYDTDITATVTLMKKKFDDFKVMTDKNYMGKHKNLLMKK